MPEPRADLRWAGWVALGAMFLLLVLVEGVGQRLRPTSCEAPPFSVTPTAAPAGATVVVTGGPTKCFPRGAQVSVRVAHSGVMDDAKVVTSAPRSADGSFTVPLVIPAGTPTGRLLIGFGAGETRCDDTDSCASGFVLALDVLP